MNSYLEYLQDLTERSNQGDAIALLQLRQELRMPFRVQARMEARRESEECRREPRLPRSNSSQEDWIVSRAAREFCASATRGDRPSWRHDGTRDTIVG